jgi:hypothetical protein
MHDMEGHMERRTFMKGAFGLALLAAGGLGGMSYNRTPQDQLEETPDQSDACGPLMRRDIVLEPDDTGLFRGIGRGVHLFNVDATGAELMRLADGSRTIEELADGLETPANPADVASFFVTLGQAGFLQNTVVVNLLEIPS